MSEFNNDTQEPEQGKDSGGAEEVGRRLKDARNEADLDINELAVRLRLTSSQLEAIEAGKLEGFGAAIYVRGYVANYARLVGLKPEPLLEMLPLDEEDPPLTAATRVMPGQRMAENLVRVATYAVGTVVLALPILWWASEGSLDALFGEPQAVLQETETAAPEEPEPDVPSGTAGSGNGESVARDLPAEDQPVMASMALVGGARQAAGKDAPEVTEPETDEVPGAAGPEGAARTLVLEVGEDSWVEIRDAAGDRLEYDLLRAGSTNEYSGSPPYRVLIGNAGAVTVRYNGAPFDLTPFVQGNLARFEVGEAPAGG